MRPSTTMFLRHRAFARSLVALLLVAAPHARAQDPLDDFMIAVANDRAPQVRALLQRGMDPNSVDAAGDPALLIAARAGNAATVDVLLDARANVDVRNRFGDTPLMVAVLQGRVGVAKKLRARGAAVNTTGWTPLIYAATGGHEELVRWLLVEGAAIDAASPNGTTALMMAAREGRYGAAVLLIERGADVNRRNDAGATALGFARATGDKALEERLRKAGARD
jgi:uncharacterized protein